MSKALGMVEQLRECLGISKASFDGIEHDLYDLAITMTFSQAHYKQDHIDEFLEFRNEMSSFEALRALMLQGLLGGMQNRMPVIFAKQHEKARKMSCWIPEGSNNKKTKK